MEFSIKNRTIGGYSFEELAKNNVEIWESINDDSHQVPPTTQRTTMGYVSEIATANHLEKVGFEIVAMNGLKDALYEMKNKKTAPSNSKSDIVARRTSDGKVFNLEVKSGTPHRYKLRQFRKNTLESYTSKKRKVENRVDFIVWVDIDRLGKPNIYGIYSADSLKKLPLFKNKFGKACYTLTNDDGNDWSNSKGILNHHTPILEDQPTKEVCIKEQERIANLPEFKNYPLEVWKDGTVAYKVLPENTLKRLKASANEYNFNTLWVG
ncbi:hypothetical protein RGQ13_08615 [Thalassotalea psychrophila]|uniref:Restriction endonuclease n=1 Tax=Thalassotalea psychrophila TaxID=3065647 RepID=A0ABY9TYX1_9GAMM|nr:hypothetical protein RGQ13_08615 [Colwelliaceae bacterium SQ149]